MRNMKKAAWGIILALAGVAVALFAIFPEYGPVGVPVWKWLVGAGLLWWLIDNLIFGHGAREHLDIFLPLGFLFMLFEKNIAGWIGREDDFVNNWLILGAAVLLTVAVKLIFSGKRIRGSSHNTLAETVIYMDAGEKKRNHVSNRLGEMNVYYQNTDIGDVSQPVILYATNRLGELVVHIPRDWKVTVRAKNRLGDISVRPNTDPAGREFILEGSNALGELAIVSP